MTEDVLQQIITHLKSGKKAAILLPAELTIDALASAIGLQGVIAFLESSAVIASAAKTVPSLPFLNQAPAIVDSLAATDQFGIKISNAHAEPGELRYEKSSDGGVLIYLKAKEGQFTAGDVTVIPSVQKPEVLVILGASTLEQLGSLYAEHPTLFFGTTIINIDNNPGNEYFGAVNLVSPHTSSLSELIVDIASAVPGSMQDDTVSTALLAGIIERTHSFRDPRTTPATLSKAARLIDAGARQQDIIQDLFKTKPFALLQLWGRALARLVAVPESSFLYSALTKSDIEKTQATAEAFPQVLRDIIEMVNDFSIIALACETERGVQLFIAGLPHVQVDEVLQKLGAPATNAHPLTSRFEFASHVFAGKNLSELQQMIVSVLPKQ